MAVSAEISRDKLSLDAAKRAAALTFVGNALEFFDFATYAFFATIISRHFFPPGDATSGLIQAFAVFGLGLVARPLGAIVFGRLGDVRGRKLALLISMPLMGVSTLIVGLIPTYQAIGVAAPVLLLACRLAQGFSAGGEVGNAITFLIEWSPPNRRALYSSLHQASSLVGTLVGSLTAAFLTSVLEPTSLQSWGWRIPFIIGGALIAPFGFYLRSKIDETPAFSHLKETHVSKEDIYSTRSTWIMGIKTVGSTAVWVVTFYVFLIYGPIFLTVHGHIDRSASLWINTAGLLTDTIVIIIAAAIADTIGRKPLLIAASLCVLIFSYPLFLMFQNSASLLLIFLGIVFCGALAGVFAGIGPALMAELFPTRLRTTGVSIGFGVSTAIFGGLAPAISESLIKFTGSEIAPSYFAMAAAVVSLGFILSLKETAYEPLK